MIEQSLDFFGGRPTTSSQSYSHTMRQNGFVFKKIYKESVKYKPY